MIMQDLWDIIKMTNLWIMSIEEKEVHKKCIHSIFKKKYQKTSQILRVIKVAEAFRSPNTQDQKWISTHHISDKAVNMQNKEWILNASCK